MPITPLFGRIKSVILQFGTAPVDQLFSEGVVEEAKAALPDEPSKQQEAIVREAGDIHSRHSRCRRDPYGASPQKGYGVSPHAPKDDHAFGLAPLQRAKCSHDVP